LEIVGKVTIRPKAMFVGILDLDRLDLEAGIGESRMATIEAKVTETRSVPVSSTKSSVSPTFTAPRSFEFMIGGYERTAPFESREQGMELEGLG